MRKEFVVSIGDLRYVSIECTCGTKLTLDMKQRTPFAKDHDFFAPSICPGCHAPYDTAIKKLADLQKAYESIVDLEDRISFRGEATEEWPTTSTKRAT